MPAPRASIIVPVYNTERYLAECLDSALGQTMGDLELICVDDGSTDGSPAILSAYAARDPRVRVISHGRNLGASQARKDGVAASRGDYVMFLDGDDELLPRACEVAYAAIAAAGTDILQFGTEVVNCTNMPQGRIDSNQRALEPCLERIDAEDGLGLVPACWEEHRFSFNLWNKIYRGDLCRDAFGMVEDGRFNCGEDLYAFFLLALCSRSYAGIKDRLYRYQFGRGRTGGGTMPLGSYEELLTERDVVGALRRFVASRAHAGQLAAIVAGIERHFRDECISKWCSDLAAGERAAGFDRLVATWGYEDVICSLAETNWDGRARVARDLLHTTCLRYEKRPADKCLTVAYYYRCIANGGAQRVAAELCNLWAAVRGVDGEPRYRIVLVCDGGPMEDEYPLDVAVARRYVPARENSLRAAYRSRFEAWQRILDEEQIDIVVYGQWVDSCALWDLLAIKGHPSHPALLLHNHNFTVLPYRWEGDSAASLSCLYQLCDGVAVLSECDRELVGAFCANVRYIVNPLGYLAGNHREGTPERHAIVWAGRISTEKRPLDLVRMMPAVLERVPDAHLYIVGEGDERLTAKLEDEIARLGFSDSVSLEGFTLEVGAWYRRAEVFVCTSDYEGFPLTIGEALSFGVPVAMYELPWLTFAQDGRGIVSVECGRWDLLGAEVARLLECPDEARALGRAGREHVEELLAVDLAAEWAVLFDGIDPDAAPALEGSYEQILLRYLTEYQERAKAGMRRRRDADAKRIVEFGHPSGLEELVAARIDLRNLGADENGVLVSNISDSRAAARRMGWLTEGGGGSFVESREGTISLIASCIGAGMLQLALRGVYSKGDDGRLVPIWVDYASLCVNGQELLDAPVAVWHGKPYKHELPVADGEVVEVSAAWRPHAEAERDAARAELAAARERTAASERQLAAVRERLAALSRASGLANLVTARVDLRNVGADSNNVRVLELTDLAAREVDMGWCVEGGHGRYVESAEGELSLRVRCEGEGTLELALRGRDVPDGAGGREAVWVDFTSLVVDGGEQLDAPVAVWHDQPFKLRRPVADGEELSISLAWRPHAEAERDAAHAELAAARRELTATEELLAASRERAGRLRAKVDTLKSKLSASRERARSLERKNQELRAAVREQRGANKDLRTQTKELRLQNKKLRASNKQLATKAVSYRASTSWKIGRAVTWLPRKLRALFKRG